LGDEESQQNPKRGWKIGMSKSFCGDVVCEGKREEKDFSQLAPSEILLLADNFFSRPLRRFSSGNSSRVRRAWRNKEDLLFKEYLKRTTTQNFDHLFSFLRSWFGKYSSLLAHQAKNSTYTCTFKRATPMLVSAAP
jgi:hypothetical protein